MCPMCPQPMLLLSFDILPVWWFGGFWGGWWFQVWWFGGLVVLLAVWWFCWFVHARQVARSDRQKKNRRAFGASDGIKKIFPLRGAEVGPASASLTRCGLPCRHRRRPARRPKAGAHYEFQAKNPAKRSENLGGVSVFFPPVLVNIQLVFKAIASRCAPCVPSPCFCSILTFCRLGGLVVWGVLGGFFVKKSKDSHFCFVFFVKNNKDSLIFSFLLLC